jgi:hypothetical protein
MCAARQGERGDRTERKDDPANRGHVTLLSLVPAATGPPTGGYGARAWGTAIQGTSGRIGVRRKS